MHKVMLAVRVVQKGELVGYCSHQLTLPFVPTQASTLSKAPAANFGKQ